MFSPHGSAPAVRQPSPVHSALVELLSHNGRLSESDVDRIHDLRFFVQDAQRHEALTRPGIDDDTIFLVLSGCVYESHVLKDGRQQIVDWFAPGELSGIGGPSSSGGLIAGDRSALARLSRSALMEALAAAPSLRRAALVVLGAELIRLRGRLVTTGLKPAIARVAGFVLESFERLEGRQAEADDTIVLPLRQANIADLLGLTGVHVNRMLRELREQGLLDQQKSRLRFVDIDGLKRVAGST